MRERSVEWTSGWIHHPLDGVEFTVKGHIGDIGMGVGYFLVNTTKRERLLFAHIAVNTRWEIAGDPVASSMVAWYMLHNLGDVISFVPDDRSFWPFSSLTPEDLSSFREVTDEVLQGLMDRGLVVDLGREVFDPKEPEVYVRKLAREWMGRTFPEIDT